MIYVGLVSKCTCHPGIEHEKYSKAWKHSIFLQHGNNVFDYGGMYIIERKIDKKKTTLNLFFVASVIIALTF